MNKIIWIMITISLFSLPAYALRDPQIPDNTRFDYKETIKNSQGKIKIQIINEKTGKISEEERQEIEIPFGFVVSSYTEGNTGFYKILLLDNASHTAIDPDRFQFIIKNDLSPVLLSYNDVSKSSGYDIHGKLQWDYPKKILHYQAKNIYGQKQEINYDVNLKNGLVYGDAISSYPLGLAIMPGFSRENKEQIIKTLAPYSKTFGMVIVDSDIVISDKAEHVVTPAGEFECYRASVVPRVPWVLKPLLFIVGMLDHFEDKFSQTYWVTNSAPYISVKYRINVAGSLTREGVLHKLEIVNKGQILGSK